MRVRVIKLDRAITDLGDRRPLSVVTTQSYAIALLSESGFL